MIQSLGMIQGIAGKNVNLPILLNVFIQAKESGVVLMTTNLEISVKTNLRAKVETVGDFTVPAKTLFDFVSLQQEEQMDFELAGNELLVSCSGTNTKIKGIASEDFPVIPEVEEKSVYAVNVKDFKSALSSTVIAAAKNEIRPELSGVYFGFFTERFGGLVMAATDSYRLSEKKIGVLQGEGENVCILPSRAVYEMVRLLGASKGQESENNVRVWLGESQLSLRYENFEISTRLVDGKYPDYSQIIPGQFKTTITVPSDVFANKIKGASLFSVGGVNSVNLEVKGKNLFISSESSQTGAYTSEIDAEVDGEDNSILLNYRYLLDGLAQLGGTARLKINGPDSPCLLESAGGEDFLYIVMPIRQ